MKILYIASEAEPFLKTGGLGDVAGALPWALAEKGHDVRLILPRNKSIAQSFLDQMELECIITVPMALQQPCCEMYSLIYNGLRVYFADNEEYFGPNAADDHPNDAERYGFFSKAVLELLPYLHWTPDILHCNDWETALIPIYLHELAEHRLSLEKTATVFTIHNVEYQGMFRFDDLSNVFGLSGALFAEGMLDLDGQVDLMKGAILSADAVTTVSPTYAEEVLDPSFSHGLDEVLRQCRGKLTGILNGIDMARHDPWTDPYIHRPYTIDSLDEKIYNKLALQDALDLRPSEDAPMLCCVTRLMRRKGMELLLEILPELMQLDVELAVLGQGDPVLEQALCDAAARYPGKMSVRIGYRDQDASATIAGSDLFLMPSKIEPCGLTQMIAMRYGVVPVVRATGGLRDTVIPYDEEGGYGTGFLFEEYAPAPFLAAIRQALCVYSNEERWYRLQKTCMEQDFGWSRSADAYSALYRSIQKL